MQTMKKGDPVVIVGYHSVVSSMIVLDDDVTTEDMSNPNSIVDTDNGWVIGPGDCFLVTGVRGLNDVRQKVKRAINKKGYYWEIRLETKLPGRTVSKRK